MFCHVLPVTRLSLLMQDEIYPTLANEAVFDGSLTDGQQIFSKLTAVLGVNVHLVSITSPAALL